MGLTNGRIHEGTKAAAAQFSEAAKWIWHDTQLKENVYCDFFDTYSYHSGSVKLLISADSNYCVYLNGEYAASGQYPDFPHYKVYDEIDLTPFSRAGTNHLAVTVWHYGVSNMSYYPGRAALRYEILNDGETVCCSDERTLSRMNPCFQSGYQKIITWELGFSFLYDMNHEDAWKNGTLAGFCPSILVEQDLPMHCRPVKRCTVGEPVQTDLLKADGDRHFLMDLKRETAGYLTFRVKSAVPQRMTVCYGEHLADGNVRRKIGERDFSAEIVLKPGENTYTNYFRRFGLRYLEFFCEEPIEVEYFTVLPVEYPLKKEEKIFADETDQKIYDTAIRTLQLCMHDHYEDTPWREQGLYALDSRNQMLFGYYGFREYDFPRANLLLFSKDRRSDNLLSICVPSQDRLAIPSFSLYYIIAVREYLLYTKDMTLLDEVYPKLVAITDAFLKKMENGGVPIFTEECYWNFYEWSDGLAGSIGSVEEKYFDSLLNCLLIMALEAMAVISDFAGAEQCYEETAEKLRRYVRSHFYDEEKRLIVDNDHSHSFSELANSFAILSGVLQGEEAEYAAEQLYSENNGLTPVTLSMLGFLYDALLKVNQEKYRDYILKDIRRRYGAMLDKGATSFWETEKGEADFDNAGSLCHGWSALPVYYLNRMM